MNGPFADRSLQSHVQGDAIPKVAGADSNTHFILMLFGIRVGETLIFRIGRNQFALDNYFRPDNTTMINVI